MGNSVLFRCVTFRRQSLAAVVANPTSHVMPCFQPITVAFDHLTRRIYLWQDRVHDFSCTGFPDVLTSLLGVLFGGWTVLYFSWHSCTTPACVRSPGCLSGLQNEYIFLCFRAIRKWEPYGGSLASVGRTTYPKGRMYIPFSRNKWVQSKHLLYELFRYSGFFPRVLFVHPLPSCSYAYW